MGKLIFEFSAMNSGKSTKLLQMKHNYESIGKRLLVSAPAVDTRNNDDCNNLYIRSRLGLEARAFPIELNDDKLLNLKKEIYNLDIEVLLIDEVQFLKPEQIYELRKMTIKNNIDIICFGLRNTYKSTPFEGSAVLLSIADKVVENISLCKVCGKKAHFNVLKIDGKIIKDGDDIVCGDEEYMSVCYKHYYEMVEIGHSI